jgi:asparagine synthase (glutamine-hydrolysing)
VALYSTRLGPPEVEGEGRIMCGFSGILTARDSLFESVDNLRFRNAADRLRHRGDTETKRLQTSTFWLVHHRLAFQDPIGGQQPMTNSRKTHVIIFNGEVYNHLDLRQKLHRLRQIPFRTRSDTETLLEGYLAYGPSFFAELDGEYAFVILSLDGLTLCAHRDPSGVKPLFFADPSIRTSSFAIRQEVYPIVGSFFSFASEMKGLYQRRIWDHEGLLRQFVGLYEPIRTPFQGVFQIPPGGVLLLHRDPSVTSDSHTSPTCSTPGLLTGELRTLSDPIRKAPRGVAGAADFSPAAFRDSLRHSVEDRLLSDVELGVYLSGGVDSRTVAALLAQQQSQRFGRQSFTVGFQQREYDESNSALDFARRMGFTAHLLKLDNAALSYAYPFAVEVSENVQPYSNGAAKWWLSRLTRQHVHGVLTGDGADELLCGYPSYRYTKWWMHIMRARGSSLSGLKHHVLGSLPRDGLYARVFTEQAENPWLSGASAQGTGLDFVDSLETWGVAHPLFGQIASLCSLLLGPAALPWLESQRDSVRSWFTTGLEHLEPDDPRNALLLWQNYFFKTHLPVQVLNWVGDRMEMANVLEGRTPFLSRRMRHLILDWSDSAFVNGLEDKYVLRRCMTGLMPLSYTRQPKKQFGAPFLDLPLLLSRYSARYALESTGLATGGESGIALLERWNKQRSDLAKALDTSQGTSASSVAARFEITNIDQALQTLASLAIVDQTLVQERSLDRDLPYETSVLAQAQRFVP